MGEGVPDEVLDSVFGQARDVSVLSRPLSREYHVSCNEIAAWLDADDTRGPKHANAARARAWRFVTSISPDDLFGLAVVHGRLDLVEMMLARDHDPRRVRMRLKMGGTRSVLAYTELIRSIFYRNRRYLKCLGAEIMALFERYGVADDGTA